MTSEPDTSSQPYYFQIRDFKEATKELDTHYVPDRHEDLVKRLRKDGWRSKDEAVVDAYWGKIDGNTIIIGARAKMMALCWLNNFLPGKHTLSAIVNAIADCDFDKRIEAAAQARERLREKFPLDHGADRKEREEKVVWAQLSRMISGSQGRYTYAVVDADDYLAITAGYYAIQLRDSRLTPSTESYTELYKRLMQVVRRRHEKPSHCARDLARELGLHVDGGHRRPQSRPVGFDFNDNLHRIDDSLESYARDREANLHGKSSFGRQVEDLLHEASRSEPDAKRLHVLTGKEHAGKKAFVGELIALLRKHEHDTETTCLNLSPNPHDGIAKLPVFAVNTRTADYLTLMIEIIVFLEEYKESFERLAGLHANKTPETFETRVKQEKERFGTDTHNFEGLLKRIETLHANHPAFFIFLDVHGSLGDSILKIINNYGIIRLLTILLRNKRSRILVTDPAPGAGAIYEKVQGKPFVHEVKISSPTIERLLWYKNEPAIADLLTDLADDVKTQVEGCALVGIAALYGYQSEGADQFETIVRGAVAAAGAQPNAKEGTPIVYRELLRRLQKHGLLEPLALICAAEDGCWDTTLLDALKYWPGGYGFRDKVFKRLESLSDASNRRFVKNEPIVRPDKEEWAYDEEAPKNQWVVSQDVAKAVFTAMHADTDYGWRKIAQHAHRLIALAARRRAQTKKMRDGFPVDLDRTAEARDIQSYVALLSSIDPDDIQPQTLQPAGKSLRLASETVFSTATFDARTALRYAIRCLLREDIDYDFRLSMVTDQDELRLRLYLLPFCLGRPKQFWSISKLRKQRGTYGGKVAELDADPDDAFAAIIPSEIPGYFKDTFSAREILEHLVTLSLTGFHCQFPKVIRWAYERAKELGKNGDADTSTGWWVAGMSRIRSSLLDMEIQRGGVKPDQLEERKQRISGWLAELHWDRALLDSNRDISGRELDILKGWMRISAREAEVEWITGADRRRAKELYDELWDMEERLADSIDQDDPIVLSGRTARRYVRFLMHDAPIYRLFDADPQDPSGEEIKEVRQLLDINISRLRRFSGADRVGVLIDMARRHHHKEEGLKFADLALKLTFAGTVSHGGKLDVLSVSAALNVLQAELNTRLPDTQVTFACYIDTARDAAELLRELADVLSFGPATATSHYLLARIAFAELEAAKHQGRDGRSHLGEAEKHIGKAIVAAEDFGGRAALRSMQPLQTAIKAERLAERAGRKR